MTMRRQTVMTRRWSYGTERLNAGRRTAAGGRMPGKQHTATELLLVSAALRWCPAGRGALRPQMSGSSAPAAVEIKKE